MNGPLDEARWRGLWDRLELTPDPRLFGKLRRALGQRHRRYHNADHVADCLRQLDGAEHPEARDPRLEMALWFHDAIYSTISKVNEEKSAAWAAGALKRAGADGEAQKLVAELILATRHQALPTNPAEQLMIDIDLSILGSPRERFDLFETQIRREYWWVPRKAYRRQRAEVLASFLDRRSVYATEEFRDRFESRARKNLLRSLERLR